MFMPVSDICYMAAMGGGGVSAFPLSVIARPIRVLDMVLLKERTGSSGMEEAPCAQCIHAATMVE